MDNKLNYKLINILIVFLILLVIYNIRFLLLGIINLIFGVFSPILISIIISYVLNLYLKKLNKFFNKYVSFIIFIFTLIGFIYVFLFKMFPLVIEQVKSFISILTFIIKDLSIKYNIKINSIDSVINYLTNFDFFNIVGDIFNYITVFMITLSISIYLFFDFNNIKDKFKCVLYKSCMYDYLECLSVEIEKYTSSFFLLVFINVIEYSLIFFIIGHPNYLFLGVMAGVFSIIPMFGGMITNVFALITSFVINYGLFIRTLIGILILSILDGYIVSPLVYSKSNKISPLLSIIAVYIGGKLFGVIGTILSLPLLIIFISVYKKKLSK